jgi:hypothetical protein
MVSDVMDYASTGGCCEDSHFEKLRAFVTTGFDWFGLKAPKNGASNLVGIKTEVNSGL